MSSNDLYEVLGVGTDASLDEIKKAYKKQALRLHPDKNQNDEDCKHKFQQLQRAYVILSDPEKREVYDESGDPEAAEELSDLKNYDDICPTITLEDIQQFTDAYRGSQEETQELIELYKQFKGDMEVVLGFQLCAIDGLDEHRYMDIIQDAIDQGQIKSYKKFQKWSEKVKERPAPKDPLEAAKKQKPQLNNVLTSIKTKQQKQFDSMVASLEAKYCAPKQNKKQKTGTKKSTKGKRKEEQESRYQEPTEEEFLAAQARLNGNNVEANGNKRKRAK
eukprot:TRINITY_DN10629_c0_g2_i2.p1 TRINITY_DN10629_c0_g2~~TRINITY_DN10629_c0_g2_i2.p1  ORF type:complete len:310 (-),score=53.27 TRINITY_DN10629_c0_g2_i2:433-1260(-)